MANDPRARLITANEPLRKRDFVKKISNKAQGVFLWVKLVVRSLLDGLSNSDRMVDLRARLDLIPADLEALYRHMITHIETLYSRRASEVFQIVRMTRHVQDLRRTEIQRTTSVTVLLLALAMEESSDAVLDIAPDSWTADRLSS